MKMNGGQQYTSVHLANPSPSLHCPYIFVIENNTVRTEVVLFSCIFLKASGQGILYPCFWIALIISARLFLSAIISSGYNEQYSVGTRWRYYSVVKNLYTRPDPLLNEVTRSFVSNSTSSDSYLPEAITV